MGKVIFVFMAVCLISYFASTSAFVHGHTKTKTASFETHHAPAHAVHAIETEDHIEVYTAFANGLFDFFAKLVRAKVEVLLWLKRAIINILIRVFAHLRHVMVHNSAFVHGVIHTVAELLKILLTSKPHFAVPHVNKIIAAAEHEYIPHGPY